METNVLRNPERKDWGAYHLSGDRHLATENVPPGLLINYYLRKASASPTTLRIQDALGNDVATLEGGGRQGVNQVHWDTSELEDLPPGIYTITVSAGALTATTFGKLVAPRAFAVGQSGRDPAHRDENPAKP